MAHPAIFSLARDPEAARAAAEQLFQAVRRDLIALLPRSAEVLHVGATAIPGCLTKGDLDIVVRIEAAAFPMAEACLAGAFRRNAGSAQTDAFAAFEDPDRTPHLGIQLTVRGGALDVFHRFTEALRADPALLRRYNDLKRAHHNGPMALYRTAKDAFVADVLRSAASPPHGAGT